MFIDREMLGDTSALCDIVKYHYKIERQWPLNIWSDASDFSALVKRFKW